MAIEQEIFQAQERAQSLRSRLERIAQDTRDPATNRAIHDALAMDMTELDNKLEYAYQIS